MNKTDIDGCCPAGVAALVEQVRSIVEQSGDSNGFDAKQWVYKWLDRPNAALAGRKPSDLMDSVAGRHQVAHIVAAMQSGAYV